MRNVFMGADADECDRSIGHEWLPQGWDEPLTLDEVKAGITAMLRRLDADGGT